MTQIDFTKRKEELATVKERIKRIKNSRFILPTTGVALLSTAGLTSNKSYSKILGLIGGIISIASLHSIWKKTSNVYPALEQEIIETDEYRLLEQKYNELLNNICELIKRLEPKNSLEIDVIMLNLMEGGFLSITDKVTHIQKNIQ